MASRGRGGGDTEARGGPASTSGATMGTTRNRTELFFKYRRQAHGLMADLAAAPGTTDQGLATAKLLDAALGASSSAAEAGVPGPTPGGALPPEYVDFQVALRADMALIRERMGELRSLHGRASLSKFEDSRGDEVAVEVLTQAVTNMFRRAEAALRRFGGPEAGGGGAADARVRQNVQRTLAVELQRLSVGFRRQQKLYLQRLRGRDTGAAAGGGGALGALDEGGGGGAGDDAFDPGFSDLQSLRVDSASVLADERDRETQKIVASIHELAQIMKDLSVLVIDQGTVLDRIDYNIEQTAAVVESGVAQLRRAETAQRRGTAAACVMILLAAVGAMALILIVKAMLA